VILPRLWRTLSHRASLLSRDHRLPKNQMQQAPGFDTDRPQNGFTQVARGCKASGRGIGVPYGKRNAAQRFQLATSLSETSRQETWYALAQLAHFKTDSHHAISGGRRIVARCASAVGTFQDVHHPRNLATKRAADDLPSLGRGRGGRSSPTVLKSTKENCSRLRDFGSAGKKAVAER
jgi:hypothetical protein